MLPPELDQRVAHRPVGLEPLLEHPLEHRDTPVEVVVDEDVGLSGVGAVEAADVLD